MQLTKILDYSASTDIAQAITVPTGSWVDLIGDQSFTVDHDTDHLLIVVRGNVSVEGSGAAASRALVDGTAGYPLGGGICSPYANILAGAGTILIPSPFAGGHTIRVQARANQSNGTGYCRAASQAPSESLSIQIFALDD